MQSVGERSAKGVDNGRNKIIMQQSQNIIEESEKIVTTAKLQIHSEPRAERVKREIFVVTVNVNELIIFIVCDAKASLRRQRKTPL